MYCVEYSLTLFFLRIIFCNDLARSATPRDIMPTHTLQQHLREQHAIVIDNRIHVCLHCRQLLGNYKYFCPCICHVQGSKVMLEGSDLGMSIDEV